MKNALYTISFLLVLAGCSSVKFSETGSGKQKPLTNSCPITVYTTSPKQEFIEVGVVDISYYCMPFICPPNDTADGVKGMVRNLVCSSGGDGILLWEANGVGRYTKATVIKTK